MIHRHGTTLFSVIAEFIHISMISTLTVMIYHLAAQEQGHYGYFGISGQSSKLLEMNRGLARDDMSLSSKLIPKRKSTPLERKLSL